MQPNRLRLPRRRRAAGQRRHAGDRRQPGDEMDVIESTRRRAKGFDRRARQLQIVTNEIEGQNPIQFVCEMLSLTAM